MSAITGYNPATVPTLTSGTYRHVALSISGTVHTLYLDGSMVAQNLSGGNVFASYTSAIQNVFIGCAGDLSYGLTGSIDDFKIWNRVLPPADISAIYYANPPPITPDSLSGLKLWLDATVTGITTTTWPDKSSFGNNLTGNGLTFTSNAFGNKSSVRIPLSKFNTNAPLYTIPITFFIVFNINNGTNYSYFAVNSQTGGFQTYIYNNTFYLGKYGGGYQSTGVPISSTGLHLIMFQLNGSGNTYTNPLVRYDRINQTIAPTTQTIATSGNLSIDATGATAYYISELIYYQSALSNTNIINIENYLASKWGTP